VDVFGFPFPDLWSPVGKVYPVNITFLRREVPLYLGQGHCGGTLGDFFAETVRVNGMIPPVRCPRWMFGALRHLPEAGIWIFRYDH
jgi:hypothetical protein